MPDLMIEDGSIQPKSPFYAAETSSGQFSLTNAARSWTNLWLAMRALGWRPVEMPRCSSHRVRVSFNLGTGSFIGDLTSNPRFFEHMMGWPIGWTAPGEPVTGYAAWLRRSRTELSRLTSLASARDEEAGNEA
ncbi:MAG: hypothetical protein ACOY4C_04005 [Pseudomonadota bacterium]